MKSLHLKIKEMATLTCVPQYMIEKDYALSYALAGIVEQPELSRSLIFKGGTALKKIFFGNYRFSEDLDFSTLHAPKNAALENALRNAMIHTKELLNTYGAFDLELKRKPERNAHPRGQEAFIVSVKFPWHSTSQCNLKIEITHDEPVVLAPEYKSILHGYDEKIDCVVACYHIEEIIAEKLRALLQTHEKLIMRGWNRSRARDYYDLWNVLKNYSASIDTTRLIKTLDKKCKHRNVSYKTIDDFFTPELISEANKHWESTLGNMLVGLPKCDLVLKETNILIKKLLNF